MRTEGLPDLPHHLVPGIVLQSIRSGHAGRNRNRQHNVAELLARRDAHDPPNGLDHIHHRISRVQEKHRIQRRHVHALRQAAGVGEDPASGLAAVVIYLCLEPVQTLRPGDGVESAVIRSESARSRHESSN